MTGQTPAYFIKLMTVPHLQQIKVSLATESQQFQVTAGETTHATQSEVVLLAQNYRKVIIRIRQPPAGEAQNDISCRLEFIFADSS